MNRILIAVAPARFMRWQQRLRDSLARRWPEAEVAFLLDPQPDDQPAAVSQLLTLERLIVHRGKPALCDRLVPPASQSVLEGEADVIVDLIGGGVIPRGPRVLRPLYDWHETEHAAVNAILSGVAPVLAVEDAATGEILAEGQPALERERTLTEGLNAVYSRVAVLLEKAIAAPATSTAAPGSARERQPAKPIGYFLRSLAFNAARVAYHLCCYSPHWRVGWRFNDGPGVLETGSLQGPGWRVLYNRNMGFAADPFPIHWRGHMGVFYESMDYGTGIGSITFQEFGPKGPMGEPQLALCEPWHLSYPILIEDGDDLYMVPEASTSDALTLYRCVEFPNKWEPVSKLLDKLEIADATIFRHDGRYWMTSVVRDAYGGYSDTLAIHHAPRLFGPWEPHRFSPALISPRFARPAGAVVQFNGSLLRPTQNCAHGYGHGLDIMRIDRLDPDNFSQSLVGTLSPGGKVWPGERLHTFGRCGRLECIDGAILTPKPLALRERVHNFIDARG